jgi:PTS system fructose-specific IIA component
MVRSDASSVTSLLSPERVKVGLEGTDKGEIIDAVVALLDGAAGVGDLQRVREDVERREMLMSTGVGKGLALPHARSTGVSSTVAAFATTARPVDYDAFDDQPVRLVLLLVGPDAERGTHVRLLSRVSRMMSDDAFRERLLSAPDADAVLDAFARAEEELA